MTASGLAPPPASLGEHPPPDAYNPFSRLGDDNLLLLATQMRWTDVLSLSATHRATREAFMAAGLKQVLVAVRNFPTRNSVENLALTRPTLGARVLWKHVIQSSRPTHYNLCRVVLQDHSALYCLTQAAKTSLAKCTEIQLPPVVTVRFSEYWRTLDGPRLPHGCMLVDPDPEFDPYLRDLIDSWRDAPHLWRLLRSCEMKCVAKYTDAQVIELCNALPLIPSIMDLRIDYVSDSMSKELAKALTKLPNLRDLSFMPCMDLSDAGMAPICAVLRQTDVLADLESFTLIGVDKFTSQGLTQLVDALAMKRLPAFHHLAIQNWCGQGADDDTAQALVRLLEQGFCRTKPKKLRTKIHTGKLVLGSCSSLSSDAHARLRMAARAGPGPRPKVRVTICIGISESGGDVSQEDAGVVSDYSSDEDNSDDEEESDENDSDEDGETDYEEPMASDGEDYRTTRNQWPSVGSVGSTPARS